MLRNLSKIYNADSKTDHGGQQITFETQQECLSLLNYIRLYRTIIDHAYHNHCKAYCTNREDHIDLKASSTVRVPKDDVLFGVINSIVAHGHYFDSLITSDSGFLVKLIAAKLIKKFLIRADCNNFWGSNKL